MQCSLNVGALPQVLRVSSFLLQFLPRHPSPSPECERKNYPTHSSRTSTGYVCDAILKDVPRYPQQKTECLSLDYSKFPEIDRKYIYISEGEKNPNGFL